MKAPVQILLVEDDLIMAVDIEEKLLQAGFGISGIARTYEEALSIIGRTTVDLAVVDVGLATEPDGIATARALLRHQRMPLIYLTGSTDETIFERAKATNPDAFLNKPLRSQELLYQIRLAVHHAEQEKPLAESVVAGAIYLPTEQGYVRVQQQDLYYLEAARNFTAVYLTDEASRRIVPLVKLGQPLMLTGNLGYWANYLSPGLFYRLSKSILINLKHVERIETHQVVIGNRILPLPDGARRNLMKQLLVIPTR